MEKQRRQEIKVALKALDDAIGPRSGGWEDLWEWHALVSFGPDVAELIFDELRDGRINWYWLSLLRAVLGDGPEIPFQHKGNLEFVAGHWRNWAKDHGFLLG